MKKFAFTLLAMATALAITPAAKATPVEFSTLGSFAGGTYASGVDTITDGTLTGTFTDVTNFMTDASPTSNVQAGYFTYTNPGGAVTTTGEGFTLQILQTMPSMNNGTLDGTITGSFSANSSTGLLTFSSTTLDLGGVTYTLLSNPLTINQTPLDTTLQMEITTTPEPASLVLLGTSLLGLAFVAFRKAKPAGSAMDLSL